MLVEIARAKGRILYIAWLPGMNISGFALH
jgi:hypothetical protein